MRRLYVLLLAVAALVLFFMLVGIDWGALGHLLLANRRYWVLLLLPYGLTCCLWTLSWRLLLVDAPPGLGFGRLFLIRLAGEALNQLTPTASLGGEPFKAVRVSETGVPWQEATASLVIHKVLTVLSLVLYIFLCLALIPFALPGLPRRLVLSTGSAAALLGAGGLAFAYLQRHNPCATLLRLLKRLGICPAFLLRREADLASLDAQLSGFYREHPRRGYLSLFLLFLGWLVHSLEVIIIFRFLGRPITLESALCFDALAQAFAAVGFMVPASVGVQDAGNVLLSLGFSFGATVGAAFGILRRFREAFWLCVGLVAARGNGGRK
ncbi:flippase-like domain-containing protein [Geomonas sp. Red875]|uniref:Flippase-like domain-containing protein n=1 Tax=Geomesophilobacter sediminis TaxID=2798584 RepID=A0A8J7JLW2_9BACT|nr:flippase-like domain-containing protein [Geomesophilobacter sediminis]